MGALVRTSAQVAELMPDVLAGGTDRPPWHPTRRPVVAAGLVLTVGLAAAGGLLLRQSLPDPAPARDTTAVTGVQIALQSDAHVVPRHLPPLPGRPAQAVLRVEVVNHGALPVRLISAALVPGVWEAELIDRPVMRPGWSAVLSLHRDVDCAPAAEHGRAPRDLLLVLEIGGRAASRTLDLGPGQTAYDGQLDEVLGRPLAACSRTPRTSLLGPIGDLVIGGAPVDPAT